MTTLDTELRLAAEELIDEFGKTITVTVPASLTYDTTDGDVTEGTETTHSVKSTPPGPYESRFIDGDVIQANDVVVHIAAKDLEFTPDNGHEVTIDSLAWKVVSVQPVYSGDLVALYTLQLRR